MPKSENNCINIPDRQDEDSLILQEIWESMQDTRESEIIDPEYATENKMETKNRQIL